MLDDEVAGGLTEGAALIDEGKWPQAGAIVAHTEKLLRTAGRDELPARLEQLQQDLTMAQRLEEIYSRPDGDGPATRKSQDDAYAEAFQAYGIDLAVLSAEEAAQRIAAPASAGNSRATGFLGGSAAPAA